MNTRLIIQSIVPKVIQVIRTAVGTHFLCAKFRNQDPSGLSTTVLHRSSIAPSETQGIAHPRLDELRQIDFVGLGIFLKKQLQQQRLQDVTSSERFMRSRSYAYFLRFFSRGGEAHGITERATFFPVSSDV